MADLRSLIQQEREDRMRAPEETATTAEQREVRQIFNGRGGPTPQAHVDGQPLEEFMSDAAAQSNLRDLIREERAGRASAASESQILTSPVPTGVPRLDSPGRTRERVVATPSEYEDPITYTETEKVDTEFFSEDQIRLQRAKSGVDYRRGLPFWERFQVATMARVPSAQKHIMQRVLADEIQNAPEGSTPLRYDTALGEWHILTQITQEEVEKGLEPEENVGKYRYIALDEASVGFNDIADLINLGEIGAIAGSIAGVRKKPFSFIKFEKPTRAAAAGGFAGGLSGRLTGDMLSVLTSVASTNGEWVPTYEELLDLGIEDAKVEALASVIGEGVGRALGWGADKIQAAQARMTNRIPTGADPDMVAEMNRNIRATQDDLQRFRNVTGKSDVYVTQGQASKSIDLIETENSLIKNAAPEIQRDVRAKQQASIEATLKYINQTFEQMPEAIAKRHGRAMRANDAIHTTDNLSIMQTEDGAVQIVSKADPGSYVTMYPRGDTWSLNDFRVGPEMLSSGMSEQLLTAAYREAAAHGKRLVSDSSMTEQAFKVTQEVASKEGIEMQVHPSVTKAVDGQGRPAWVTDGLQPVLSSPEPETAMTRALMMKDWKRFIRRPGASEMGAVRGELENNPFLRNEVRKAMLEDFKQSVRAQSVDGEIQFSEKAWAQWKEDTMGTWDLAFTPREQLDMRLKPEAIHTLVKEESDRLTAAQNVVSRNLDLDPKFMFSKDPTRQIWDQLRKKDRGTVRRTMAVLDRAGMGDGIRQILREEMRREIIKTSGAAAKSATRRTFDNFEKWLKTHERFIRDVYPRAQGAKYVQDLKAIARQTERRAVQNAVTGVREEANPSALAFFRVLFGPLSRIQRFLTAGRRYQTRQMGAAAVELISDPAKLSQYMSIRAYPIGTRAWGRAMTELGLAGYFPDFDLSDPDDLQTISEIVYDVQAAAASDMGE